MISVEATSKGSSAPNWGQAKGGPSGAHWDPASFERQVNDAADDKWKETSKKKSPSRLQDISMGMGEEAGAPKEKGKEQSWPFDSSPCAWSDRANARKAGNEKNAELFDSNFAANPEREEGFESMEGTEEMDSSDVDSATESFCGDSDPDLPDLQEEVVPTTSATSLSQRGDTMLDPSAPYKGNTDSYCTGLAWNRTNKYSDLSDGELDSSKHSEKGGIQSATAHPRLRTASTDVSASTSKSKSKSKDPLATSCHGQIETKLRKSSSRRHLTKNKRQEKDMLSATCHGKLEKTDMQTSRTSSRRPTKRREDEPVAMPGEMQSSRQSSRRKQPPRSRSGTKDDLAGASVHGVASVSRVRSGSSARRNESSRPKPIDRRARLTRAMSTANVKPPEEHHQRRDTIDEGLDVSRSGGRSRRSSLHGKSRSSSSRNVSKKISPRKQRLASRSESETSEEESGYTRSKDYRDRGSNRSSQRKRSSVPERRDLLVLLREKKSVNKNDFMDKENRRLLHFLLYEHKMDVSIRGLHASIKKDLQAESDQDVEPRPLDPAM